MPISKTIEMPLLIKRSLITSSMPCTIYALVASESINTSMKMIDWEHSEYDFIRRMAGPMKIKFDKYRNKCFLVLAVALVFDPRYKMSLVEYYYTRTYGSSVNRYITRVCDTLKDLFLTYGSSRVSLAGDTTNASRSIINRGTEHHDYERWYDKERGLVNQKSEWGGYIDERRYPSIENFNILNCWRTNSPRLSILAKIACDVLVVPATIVASEAGFGVGGHVNNESCASLHPDAVEALVVAGDWIKPVPKKDKSISFILIIISKL